MTDQLYKIKPLEWRQISEREWVNSISGHVIHSRIDNLFHVWGPLSSNKLSVCAPVQTLEEAKAAANEHYIKRMEERLIKA